VREKRSFFFSFDFIAICRFQVSKKYSSNYKNRNKYLSKEITHASYQETNEKGAFSENRTI
jgi:hypothetical protein